jgi:DNA-binding beta-propeller fold protein YncE
MTASPAAVSPGTGTQTSPEPAGPAETTLGPDGGEGLPPVAASPTDGRRRRRKAFVLLLLLLGLAIVIGLAIWYLLFRQPIPLPTIPGNVVMPGYVTSISNLNRPLGVAVSDDGSLIYAGQTEGDRIARLFDASGNVKSLLQPPVSTGSDHVPVYLARDPLTNEVYVSDRPTGAIYIYDASGNFQRQYTTPESLKGWQPLALAFDKAGNLWASDVSINPQTVIEIDRSGKVLNTFGKTEGLSYPNGIGIDSAGNVFVSDSNNGRLVVFDKTGSAVARVGRGVGGGALGMPRGVAIGADDKVYVADSTGHTVFVYAPYKSGAGRLEFLGAFGSEGVANSQFEFPNGLALDGRGRIYVVDSGNGRIQVWSY